MNENSIDGVFFLSLAGLICTSTTLLIRYCYKSNFFKIKVILKVTSRTVTSSGCAKKQGPKEPTWLTK